MADITTSDAGNLLDPTKWGGGVCPGTSDTAIIAHAMTLTDGQSVQYAALRKSGSGAITATGACSILSTPCTHDVGSSAVAIVAVTSGTFTGTGSTFTGGDASGERGITVSAGASVVGCASVGGSAGFAYGIYNAGTCTSCSGTGGSASVAYGIYNAGTCTSCSGTGGSVSGAYGIINYGGVDNLTAGVFTGTGTGRRGIHSPAGGLVIVDGANIHGDNYIHGGRLYLRGTLAGDHALTGTYTLYPIPAASLVASATDYLDTVGTYPTTATTQAADAATLTAATLDVDGTDTTVAFGASNGTAKTAAVWTAAQVAQLATDRAAGASVFGGHISRRV